MERLLYWTLFAVSVVLAAWLPVNSAYPQWETRIAQLLTGVRL
jgi:hypothetical protein